MNISFKQGLSLRKFLPLLLVFLILYAVVAAIILYLLQIRKVEVRLKNTISRIREDVTLKNGIWNVASYNADSNISDEDPLYIITSEGFIIERIRPIHGLLDLSRFSAIADYTTPQTLTTVTNEKWRVFSLPIIAEDRGIAIIMVAIYAPDERNLAEIDKQIKEIVAQIRPNITVKEDSIDVSQIDIRKIPFNASFQIVNRFNKVILQSHNSNSVSRIPSFIDRSYIESQLKRSKEQVEDSITHKKFLTLTSPVRDEKNSIAGIIVVGESIDDIYRFAGIYGLLNLGINTFLSILAIPIVSYYILRSRRKNQLLNSEKLLPKKITFMKKACKLIFDRQEIDIPYASYQYYFCDALFQKPKKKWEVDELLEIFGEDFGIEKWRKVYDTMVALDRKTSRLVSRLFMIKNKRYFINPELLPLISYVHT